MCGITGIWISGAGDVVASSSIAAMTQALRHRGPDSQGTWLSEDRSLALGHTRLAIVDLSEQGAQPMTSPSGRYVTVFNGEIYNHFELRSALGPTDWRGHSDTESLLAAIERWGLAGTLERAVGMFALALWDRRERRLQLARDRIGEKPLYYAAGRHGFAFASEIKSLQRCPGVDLALDMDAMRRYVQYGFVFGELSAFRGIRRLPPATILSLDSPCNAASMSSYWSLPPPVPAMSAAPTAAADRQQVDALASLLERSVSQQMLSDVPLGAFLSGGIDSSLIVALMQRASSRPVKTFSMGFDGGDGDELGVARGTAALLGTSHTELLVSPQDVLDVVPGLAAIYDEPFADASQIPTVLLSRLTRRHVTVALSGDAGDELFGGYNRYRVAESLGPLLTSVPRPLRVMAAALLRRVPAGWLDRPEVGSASRGRRRPPALDEKLARLAQFIESRDGSSAYLGMLSQWTRDDAVPLDSRAPPLCLDDMAGVPLAQRMMCWDMRAYLPDDILVKVDRAAMASSLETRVPFLDHRVVEFALRTPMCFKIRTGQSKWLLRRLLERHLPTVHFDRPKQGFTVPLDDWLRGPLRDWAEDLLDPARLAASDLLDVDIVRHIWSEHLRGHNHQRGLWTVLMLQSWFDGLSTTTATPVQQRTTTAAVDPAAVS